MWSCGPAARLPGSGLHVDLHFNCGCGTTEIATKATVPGVTYEFTRRAAHIESVAPNLTFMPLCKITPGGVQVGPGDIPQMFKATNEVPLQSGR
ncbi:MAG: hypothetical protein CMJ21_03235 [Phycisphaerae bacterium]|nr:hypothetical protein [Phycisphaerae bacterium]